VEVPAAVYDDASPFPVGTHTELTPSRATTVAASNFPLVSADAALVTDLVRRVSRECHDVRYYVVAGTDRDIGDGLVPKTEDWHGFRVGLRVVFRPFPFDDGATYHENSRNDAVVFRGADCDAVRLEDATCVSGETPPDPRGDGRRRPPAGVWLSGAAR